MERGLSVLAMHVGKRDTLNGTVSRKAQTRKLIEAMTVKVAQRRMTKQGRVDGQVRL